MALCNAVKRTVKHTSKKFIFSSRKWETSQITAFRVSLCVSQACLRKKMEVETAGAGKVLRLHATDCSFFPLQTCIFSGLQLFCLKHAFFSSHVFFPHHFKFVGCSTRIFALAVKSYHFEQFRGSKQFEKL